MKLWELKGGCLQNLMVYQSGSDYYGIFVTGVLPNYEAAVRAAAKKIWGPPGWECMLGRLEHTQCSWCLKKLSFYYKKCRC